MHLVPGAVLSLRQDSGRYRELDILNLLADWLPGGYEIFHSIALHTVRDSLDYYGEIDIVVLSPTGNMLLIEVKAARRRDFPRRLCLQALSERGTRYRSGGAGSGKTQLALRLLEQAAADGRAAGYICYNRSLADHVRRSAPSRAEVSNFHELAVEHFRDLGRA